jgi:hypothetical protein
VALLAAGAVAVVGASDYLSVVCLGLAAVAIGAFNLGGYATPDPVAHQRARNAERALVELGLTYGADDRPSRDTGPVDPTGEPVRVKAQPIQRGYVPPPPDEPSPRRGTVDGMDTAESAHTTVERLRGLADEPPIGGPE